MTAREPPPAVPTMEYLPQHGVTSLRVWCGRWPHACTHHAVVPLDEVDLRLTILEFAAMLTCEVCGHRGGTAMPAWPAGPAHRPGAS
ncbi:MAG: hypothetical protein Q8N51_18095 [Gammaproteobacteria bacterium]|nr:hypothetical protein [Gammaproteobacteria bacterium]